MELQTHEKNNIILLLDEMAIRSEINYNSKRDMIDGFEDNGFKRSKVIAKQLCVFMLKSMFSNWSVILNYFVSKNGLTASELQQIILENIRIVERLGMRVKVIICDQGSANRKCFSEFGVTVEKPYVLHNNEKIICIYDFPHLIKSLRNGWLKCDMETLDGRVSFKVIQELWELEEGATTKMCTKLTRRHIYPNSFEKMKVKLATQVFSHTVHSAIKTVNDTCGFKKNSKELASCTASFVEKIDKIFDCLNSSSLRCPNLYKSALQRNNTPYQFIKYFQNYLNNMKFVDDKKKVFFLDGMKMTLNGVLLLFDEVLNDKVFFLMTRTLNQDKLENAFSILRQKGGNNTNPSIAEVNYILARLLSAKIVQLSSNTNCEEVKDNTIEMLQNILQDDDCHEEEESADIQEDEIENTVAEIIDEFPNQQEMSCDMVSLRYFLGFIILKMLPKLNCNECLMQLKKDEEVLSVPSE